MRFRVNVESSALILRKKGLSRRRRYDARDGSAYLTRPDQHIAACMREATVDKIRQAVARATAQQ